MPKITLDDAICTVIVTVDADPELMPALEAHARLGIERFPEFSGFLGGALHVSEDGGRLVQYLQWGSEVEYLECLNDPQWEQLESTVSFLDTVRAGEASLDARTFRVRVVSESRTDA
jgi:hypothetical protein